MILWADNIKESLLDYVFLKMGVSGSEKVEHPLLMTEPVCNPNYTRGGASVLFIDMKLIGYTSDVGIVI